MLYFIAKTWLTNVAIILSLLAAYAVIYACLTHAVIGITVVAFLTLMSAYIVASEKRN